MYPKRLSHSAHPEGGTNRRNSPSSIFPLPLRRGIIGIGREGRIERTMGHQIPLHSPLADLASEQLYPPPPIQGPISTNCFVVYFTFFNIAIVRSFKAISWILRANILGQIRISRIIKLISEGFKFKLRPRAQFFLKRINSCHTANLNFYYRVFLRSKPIFAQLEANHSIPKFLRSQTKDVDSYNLTHKILASDLH